MRNGLKSDLGRHPAGYDLVHRRADERPGLAAWWSTGADWVRPVGVDMTLCEGRMIFAEDMQVMDTMFWSKNPKITVSVHCGEPELRRSASSGGNFNYGRAEVFIPNFQKLAFDPLR